ncbi:uncharacterized protein LOC105171771 [Sesamum indicum]|uniref:Uncharacterized protein LOC105171771 n=1 Tax=Sesamum indicum TaxID=4182 RepID=A0A6I9U3P2_SESIN|nr:uncharacterized protein LOC105171771 [Sesamum indicum]
MQASDRFNINSQLEHLQAKYVGTGHADLTRLCIPLRQSCLFSTCISYASYIGHYPILPYFSGGKRIYWARALQFYAAQRRQQDGYEAIWVDSGPVPPTPVIVKLPDFWDAKNLYSL